MSFESAGTTGGRKLRTVQVAAAVAVAAGVAAFAALALRQPRQAWCDLLVNFLYFSGLAQAAVIWTVMLRLAGARWSGALNRAGEACVVFLPFSLLLLIAVFLGRGWLFPWLHLDVGDRRVWFNAPGLLARNLLGMGALTALSLLYVRWHLLIDAGKLSAERMRRPITVVAVTLVVLYLVVYSVLTFDFIMGLRPFWNSTVLGWYFMAGAQYAAMALLLLLLARTPTWPPPERRMHLQGWLDAGNLMQAFGMATTYMFFAQLLVIWYENLPHETDFLIARYHYAPWHSLTWVVLLGAFLGPFVLLTVRAIKIRVRALEAVAVVILVGMWLERYLLVAPSLLGNQPHFGALDALVAVGHAGLLVACLAWFVGRYPGAEGGGRQSAVASQEAEA